MPSNGFISRARQVVLDNLLNPQFGVSALAKELGISRSELYRRIKEGEQKSASQFIREIRLERALELATSTDVASLSDYIHWYAPQLSAAGRERVVRGRRQPDIPVAHRPALPGPEPVVTDVVVVQ